MDVQLAKRNAEALKEVIISLKNELKEQRALMEGATTAEAYKKAAAEVDKLIMKVRTLEKVQRSATPASAYEAFISGDRLNSNQLKQAIRGGKNRLGSALTQNDARQLINDVQRATMELNRLQAGFTKPLQSVKKELRDLSGGELQRLHQVLEQEQQLLVGNDKAWAAYAVAISKVEQRMQEYDTVARQAMGEKVLKQAQGGAFLKSNEREIQRVIEKLMEYRRLINDPKGSGKGTYDAVTSEIQKLKIQLSSLNVISKESNAVLNSPKGKSFNELKIAIDEARAKLNTMRQTTEREKQAYDQLAASIKQADIQMKSLAGSAKGTATSFDKAWSRLKTYIGLYMGAAVAIQKLVATMGDLMELSDKMGEVRKTTGFTAQEVGNLSRSLAKLDTRTPIQGLMELSAVAGQLGLKTEQDVKGFTEAANMLMVALPELGKEGATAMLKVALATGEIDKIRKQLQEGTIKGSDAVSVAMTKIGSTIDALRANSAAAAPAITDFVKRVGAVGAQSGISIDQVAALGSTVDALGMRVEMSATALSRMLPAIRNNAFDLARAVGVTPETIRNLYDTGRGMEAVLMILQHIKDSGADAESIETMLGKGGMADVMKDLNQQGARAGIVFAGLSQNVEELRRQLGVAKTAYEENVAIQNEYNKMNDTTAAKWERLKNEIEEMFVSDSSQRWFGELIDWMKVVVHFIAEDGPIVKGLKVLATYAIALKIGFGQAFLSMGGGFRNMGIAIAAAANQFGIFTRVTAGARAEWAKFDTAMKANIWGAFLAAVGMAIWKLSDYVKATKEAAAEIGRFNESVNQEVKSLDKLFMPLNKSNIAYDERNKLIREINSKYSKYLGYMLSETTQAVQLAEAHALIAKRIREEAYEKRILDQENAVYEKYEGKMSSRYGSLVETIRRNAKGSTDVGSVADALKDFIDKNLKDIEADFYMGGLRPSNKSYLKFMDRFENYLERLAVDGKINRDGLRDIKGVASQYIEVAKKQAVALEEATANTRADLRNIQREIGGDINANLNRLISNITNFGEKTTASGPPAAIARAEERRVTSLFDLKQPQYDWRGNANVQANAAMPLPSWKSGINKKNIEEVKQFVEAQDQLRGYLETNAKNISEQAKATAEAYLVSEEEMKELRELLPKGASGTSGGGGGGGTGAGNPWGTPLPADSSAYADMDADALVARRKQMNKFVRALQTDTDVNSVLKEDAQLRKAIENGMSSDMRTVIEWYNTERKKIQEELHGRHLTNTGDWLDAKSGRKTKKATEDTYALAELERYYQWRKEIIEDARIEEGLSETEFNRRMDALEQEHLKKRSDLRRRFTTEDKQFVIQFEQWWASVEELDEVNWSKINDEWASATGKQRKYNDRKMQKDLADMKAITVKQLNAIADIIAKERPYDGITKNLQDNLTKMGILFADLDAANNGAIAADKGKVFDDAKYVEENMKRLKFLLGEAENAYSITIEDLLRKMAENGLEAWADEIGKSNAMKAGLMAQLRTVFDSVQQAIKKEATLVRKEMDIVWNDVSDADGKSLKQTFEGWLSGVGQLEDSVKRANSLISAGYASENVANKLAIKQMQIRLQMQATYYDMMKKMWDDRIKALQDAGKMEDAEHARKSKNLSLAEEQKKLDEQRVAIAAKLEESQNNLYKNLREWGDLLASSLQSLFEASNAGNEKFYNERAKLRLTGGTGEMQQIIVIDNAGTSGAKAHYETHDEMGLLQREREIEQQNAVADAWKKVMDDINQKMNDMITDQINAMLQNASVDANTDALGVNTKALNALTEAVLSGKGSSGVGGLTPPQMPGVAVSEGAGKTPAIEFGPFENVEVEDANGNYVPQNRPQKPWGSPAADAETVAMWQAAADASTEATGIIVENAGKQAKAQEGENQKMAASTQSAFAKMTQAANLYGIAYQAMSNDNMTAAQKFGMVAIQAAGNAAITALTADMSQATGDAAINSASVWGKLWNQLGWWAIPVYALFTGTLGGLMGLAASKIAKSKSEIASVTGANNSVASGRLSTGMLTYAEGNVNEFTDPGSLTPGRSYNVDGADGKTYRAKYTGRNPQTHITNGPEFHLAGEDGKEAIIDARTTRLMQMDDTGIWRAIQVLYNGGSLQSLQRRRRGRGIPAFAGGNLDDFDSLVESDDIAASGAGASQEQMVAFQQSLDRNSAVLERALTEGIRGVFDVYGKGGLIDSYDSGKKTATRYGQRY